MSSWNPQHYAFEGQRLGVQQEKIDASIKIINQIQSVDHRLPVILTLRHFCFLVDARYFYLRRVISRDSFDYKRVLFKKQVPGRSRYREIHIPGEQLLKVQQWITNHILSNTTPHSTSFAYHPHSRPDFAAIQHCGCKWLLKIDIEDFFHNISESMVYSVFRKLGYTKLFSFELARITTISPPNIRSRSQNDNNRHAIPLYRSEQKGFLPQGAPTSPMLSNLVMTKVDQKFEALANSYDFRYTRYADDLAFSTKKSVTMAELKKLKKAINSILQKKNFNINNRKTSISGPGSRRIVLGILVDGSLPRLTKEYKNNLRQHLYYLSSSSHGPSKHAEARNISTSSMYHHVKGKIGWAKQVEPKFGLSCLEIFESINWPPVDNF